LPLSPIASNDRLGSERGADAGEACQFSSPVVSQHNSGEIEVVANGDADAGGIGEHRAERAAADGASRMAKQVLARWRCVRHFTASSTASMRCLFPPDQASARSAHFQLIASEIVVPTYSQEGSTGERKEFPADSWFSESNSRL
jgi:hypothetical protein